MAKDDGGLLKILGWVALVVAIIYLVSPDTITGLFAGVPTTTGGTASTISTATSCPNNDDLIAFSSDDVRKDKLGSNIGQSYRLFVGATRDADIAKFPSGFVDKGSNADASSLNVPTLVPYREIAGWNGGTESLVYREVLDGNTDCFDPLTVQPVLAVGDTNVSVYVTDEDGSLNGAGGSATFNISAGQDFSFSPTLFTSTDQYWGNPYVSGDKNIMVVQYNSTLYSDILIPSLAGASVPDVARNNGTGWERKAFYVPSLTSSKFNFKVDADVSSSATNVQCQTIHSRNDIYFELYDASYDLDADTNQLIIGVEDENNNNLAMTDSLNRFKENVGCS